MGLGYAHELADGGLTRARPPAKDADDRTHVASSECFAHVRTLPKSNGYGRVLIGSLAQAFTPTELLAPYADGIPPMASCRGARAGIVDDMTKHEARFANTGRRCIGSEVEWREVLARLEVVSERLRSLTTSVDGLTTTCSEAS